MSGSQHEAGLSEDDYVDFPLGTRVRVVEGLPGTVTAFWVGSVETVYHVVLDDGAGGGEWGQDELTPLGSAKAVTASTAGEDYPELDGALEERPDLDESISEADYLLGRVSSLLAPTVAAVQVHCPDCGDDYFVDSQDEIEQHQSEHQVTADLYLPIKDPEPTENHSQAYRDGFEQGKHHPTREPNSTDPDYLADFELGWADGVKAATGVPEPASTDADELGTPFLDTAPVQPNVTMGGLWDFIKGDDTPSKTWAGPGHNWSSDWCFLPDAPVTMADGSEKPISEVEVGDQVVTHLGNIRSVTWTGSRHFDGDISRVRVFGDSTREFVSTSEHRVFGGPSGQADWVPVGSLAVGDYLTRAIPVEQAPLHVDLVEPLRGGWGKVGARGVVHRPAKASPWVFRSPEGSRHFATREDAVAASVAYHQPKVMSLKVDENLSWLLGLYAGDGSIPRNHGYVVSFSIHRDQTEIVERLRRVTETYFGASPSIYPDKGAFRVDVRHWALQALCETQVGRGSQCKGFAAGVMSMPLSEQQALLEGYLDADGHHRSDGGHNVSSVSAALSRQVREIRARLGGVCNQRWDSRDRGEYANGKPSIRTEWWNDKNHLSRQHIIGGQVYHQIISTEQEHYAGSVWDIEVEEDHSFRAYGMNVHNCRFRRNSRCMFPKELNKAATDIAGYNVWIPTDRGYCPRISWEDQQACEISEPGPNVPGGYTDATVPWSEGGQRGGTPVYSSRSTDDEVSGDSFRWHFTAAWSDVRTKAKRIRSAGHLRVLSVLHGKDGKASSVVAQVRGDHHVYQTTVAMVPDHYAVGSWECGCAWSAYSWGRTGPWKKYEGRMCSHALSLVYEAQSRGMFGHNITEDQVAPAWLPKGDIKAPGDWDRDSGGYTAALDTPVSAEDDWSALAALVATGAPIALIHRALLDSGVLMTHLRTARRGRLKAKTTEHGMIQDFEFVDGQVLLNGHPYDGPVFHPHYDERAGLNFVPHAARKEATMSADEWGLSLPDHDPTSRPRAASRPVLADDEWGMSLVSTFEEDPQPALPTTDGDGQAPVDAGDVEQDQSTSRARQTLLAAQGGAQQRREASQPSAATPETGDPHAWLMKGSGSSDIAAKAREFLSKSSMKDFTPAERAQIIDEGAGTTARNLGSLDLTGTHYQQIEDLTDDGLTDDTLGW